MESKNYSKSSFFLAKPAPAVSAAKPPAFGGLASSAPPANTSVTAKTSIPGGTIISTQPTSVTSTKTVPIPSIVSGMYLLRN